MVLLYSTAMIFVQSVPATQATEQNVATLESTLEQMHLTRIYSDYWTCAVVILETQEQVICGSTDNNLAHISDRYAPYLAMVEAAPNLTFVYKDGAAQLATLNQYIDRYHIQYQRTEVPGYVIYQITGKIPTLNL
jgi:hypothetical protein